jgi:hypothetical protein
MIEVNKEDLKIAEDQYHGNDDHIASSHQRGMSDMQDNETIGARERFGSIVNMLPIDAKEVKQ